MAGKLKAWEDGYAWAGGNGPYARKGCEDAMELCGYDFGSKDSQRFLDGCKCGQDELFEGIYQWPV